MPCPFSGKHAVPLMNLLVTSQGNQCALITSSYAPCRLEMEGDPAPDLGNCEWKNSQRAVAFAQFETRHMHDTADHHYPD